MLSRRSSKTLFIGVLALSLALQKSINSWLDLVSHIPSQPISMNSSLGFKVLFLISGTAMISYSPGGKSSFFLYSKSPSALERFKFPLILPSVIYPPAFLTLSLSDFNSGLWSSDNSKTLPFSEITHLESPAFAIYKSLKLWIRTTLAVQPA